jgi:signal peptidase II
MTEPTETPPPQIYPPTNGGRTRTRWERIHAYRLLWIVSLGLFALDQLTKLWVVYIQKIPFNPYHDHDGFQDITIIPGFFYLIHVGNTGAAWSILSGKSTLLAMLALGTLVAIFFYRRTLGLHVRSLQVSFGLLCGGIVGNLIDRLAYGHVVDFLDFHFGDYIYPTFNIADCGICVGVILYLWHSWRAPELR